MDTEYRPPKQLEDGAGFNEPDWKGAIQCLGTEPGPPVTARTIRVRNGCGRRFEIGRAHLFTHGFASEALYFERVRRIEQVALVWFRCPACGIETTLAQSRHFKGLPSREEWARLHPEPPTNPELTAETFAE